MRRRRSRSRPRPRLQRQLFLWLALTITVTALTIALVFRVFHPFEHRGANRLERLEAFGVSLFAEAWDDTARRRALGAGLSDALGARLRVEDASGRLLEEHGGSCRRSEYSVPVRRDGVLLGTVHGCWRGDPGGPLVALVALSSVGFVLWAAAAALARRLTRPLVSLIEVTREIGQGNLKSRVRLGRRHRNELGVLAESVNEMAERLERQLAEQRELLAVVSHEVRSPLARLRVSTEILRDDPANAQALGAIEREVAEIDTLVGKLLASSRLDFGSLARVPLDPVALARTALERRSLPRELLDDRSDGAECTGDPTLIARALDNLLDNAGRHGSSVVRLLVRSAQPWEFRDGRDAIVFEVWDRGPGFDPAALPHAFDAFAAPRARSATNGDAEEGHVSLGLGLSLVRRIAEAHGGRAWAKNLPEGGARVGFSVG